MGVKTKDSTYGNVINGIRMQLLYETGCVSRNSVQCHIVPSVALALSQLLARMQGRTKLACIGRKGGLPRTSSAVFADLSTEE